MGITKNHKIKQFFSEPWLARFQTPSAVRDLFLSPKFFKHTYISLNRPEDDSV